MTYTLEQIRDALKQLADRIKKQRRAEADKLNKQIWTEDLDRALDLIELVNLAIAGECLL